MKVKVTQSSLTLCYPMDYTVHGILQARILEWVVFSFSSESSQLQDQTRSPTLQVDSLPAEPQGKPLKPCKFGILGNREHPENDAFYLFLLLCFLRHTNMSQHQVTRASSFQVQVSESSSSLFHY